MAQVDVAKLLRFLADNIDAGFNGKPGPEHKKETAFFLAIMPYNSDFTLIPKPEVHYIANVDDPRLAEMLKDVFETFGYHCLLKATPET